MAKIPEAGRVKTRLARQIGVSEATRAYRRILSGTLQRLGADPRWRTWIAVAPDTSIASPVWPRTVSLMAQGKGNLGQRMQRVFDRLPGGPAIIIGSDIPGISPQAIADGFKALGSSDAVIGPAPDGGFWLIGQKRRPRVLQIFQDVRWSGPHAMADTMANLKQVSTAQLELRADVDTAGDYRAWRRSKG